jgi:hypothetical protein
MSLIATFFTKSSVVGAWAAKAAEVKNTVADSPAAAAISSRLMSVLRMLPQKAAGG